MNYIIPTKLRLSSRNEGKIKAYESCTDVRAWSHDVGVRDRYLKEWIKGDMTVCFIPVSTLAQFLRVMTYKNRGKATPRCHPDCKSKVILESICASCNAMKECLKNNADFQKYFDEEDFDTCHWPCERCMEAMKSVKMFWKIIVEKLFNINLLKNEGFKENECGQFESVHSVAKQWQEEILQQAVYVKKIKPLWNKGTFQTNPNQPQDPKHGEDKEVVDVNKKGNAIILGKSESYTIKAVKATDTNSLSSSVVKKSRRRLVSCSRRSNKMVDKYCETCNIENENRELNTYKTNLLDLQNKFTEQQDEIDKLRADNHSLKMELQNLYEQFTCNCALYSSRTLRKGKGAVAVIPKPFETFTEVIADPVKSIDSEMIITMKNCKNESYRHVSLLQVLHKSNGPIHEDTTLLGSRSKKEDPISILTRVHNTFGEIVKREMSIVNERNRHPKTVNIDATFDKMNLSGSTPSCSTKSSSSSDFFISFNGDGNSEK